jgi:hypothetical protein
MKLSSGRRPGELPTPETDTAAAVCCNDRFGAFTAWK